MTMTKDVIKYVGDLNQLISFHDGKLIGGFSDGTRFMEVHNGGNISATILPDRCMGIYQVRYKGYNLNYLTQSGIVAPQYYENQGSGWMNSFFAGMLSTMGLEHIGDPRTDASGTEIGLHGRIDNTPAENVTYNRELKNGIPSLTIEGTMREAAMCSYNLTLKRKISFEYQSDSIVITDTITNHGYNDFQVLYGLHLNFGYPLLNKETIIDVPSVKIHSKDDWSLKHVDSWNKVEAPSDKYPYRVYTHEVKKDKSGMSGYTVFNPKLGIGVNVKYDATKYPFLGEWKNLAKGEYVMSLEPMNTSIIGPKQWEKGCTAPILRHDESIEYNCTLNFIDKYKE